MTKALLNGGLKLTGNYPDGFNGWGAEMNRNLELLSYGIQPSVLEINRTTRPATEVIGATYIVAAGHTFGSHIPANSIVVFDIGVWRYVPPAVGMQVYNQATLSYYKYNGAAWEPVIPPFAGVACNLDSDYTIPTLNTYLRVPFNDNGCTISPVGINANTLSFDYYFNQGGVYQAHFAAEINNNSATGKGITGRIVLVKSPNFNEIIVAESASVLIISNADNLQRIGVQMSGLFSVAANDSINFQVSGSQNYTLASGPRTRFSVYKVG